MAADPDLTPCQADSPPAPAGRVGGAGAGAGGGGVVSCE